MNPSIASDVSETQVSDGQRKNLVRLVEDAARKAAGVVIDELVASGTLTVANVQRVLAQGDRIASVTATFVKGQIAPLITDLAENVVGHLKLLAGGKKVGKTNGTEMLGKADDVFVGIDSDFENYGCNRKGRPTDPIDMQVYEMVKDGTSAQIFGGFGENLDRLCLTQGQIKKFVVDHRDMLHTDGYGTFFLFKVGNKLLVAGVGVSDDGRLKVNVNRLSNDNVWNAENRHRIVVPKLTISLIPMWWEFC